MRAALRQSWLALPACRPNPPVGCVIVFRGKIVASGFTGAPGMPHAEFAALSKLEQQLPLRSAHPREFTLYVTLEPCSFVGRTPACARKIIEHGVGRVVVGLIDPHPRNRGTGLEMLKAAGIEVELGLLADEISPFLAPHLLHSEDDGHSHHHETVPPNAVRDGQDPL